MFLESYLVQFEESTLLLVIVISITVIIVLSVSIFIIQYFFIRPKKKRILIRLKQIVQEEEEEKFTPKLNWNIFENKQETWPNQTKKKKKCIQLIYFKCCNSSEYFHFGADVWWIGIGSFIYFNSKFNYQSTHSQRNCNI